MRTKKGFTLIELMVAMGIIAILAAMSVYGISIVQRSLRNTERRKVLEQIKLSVEEYKTTTGAYPGTANLTITANSVQLGGVEVVELTGAATAQTTETDSGGTAYCYIPDGTASYQLGVDLEGSDWGHQLGDPALGPCADIYPVTP
jgi:prepilin-type N-terminal cleavage/methylation domain-containing protein